MENIDLNDLSTESVESNENISDDSCDSANGVDNINKFNVLTLQDKQKEDDLLISKTKLGCDELCYQGYYYTIDSK